MAEPYVGFTRPTARRIVDAVRDAEGTPRDETGRDLVFPSQPRNYRPFELTEALVAGGTAEVKWLIWNTTEDGLIDTELTGEVTDYLDHSWGLPGDRGEALWIGGKWVVIVNPGQHNIFGKLDADLLAGSSATMSIWEGETLADSTRNLTVYDWFLPTGKKIASGAKVKAVWYSGKWYVDTTDTCPVDA